MASTDYNFSNLSGSRSRESANNFDRSWRTRGASGFRGRKSEHDFNVEEEDDGLQEDWINPVLVFLSRIIYLGGLLYVYVGGDFPFCRIFFLKKGKNFFIYIFLSHM